MAIAANSGGAQALDKVLGTRERLRAAGFGVADIVAMAAHNGGAPALQAVSDHLSILQTRYGIKEIVRAGAKRRGRPRQATGRGVSSQAGGGRLE